MRHPALISLCVLLPLYGTNELALIPSAGMPTIQIMGETAIDLQQITPGDLISYDITFTQIDFNFAACELKIYYPLFLISLSEQPSDWINATGAVFVPSVGIADVLALPIDPNGNRIGPDIITGGFRIGLVFADSLTRWQGTPGMPHPGGLLGAIRFIYHGAPFCSSRMEPVQALIGPTFADGRYDFFSDAGGNRVPIVTSTPLSIYGLEGLSAYFGDVAKKIRADANQDDSRDPLDALPAALCTLNGQNSSGCPGLWQGVDPAVFNQTFDFNCDGGANAPDALGLARLALGIREVTSFEESASQRFQPLPATGTISITDDAKAALVFMVFEQKGLIVSVPRIAGPGGGWTLLSEQNGPFTEILLVHGQDAPIPMVVLDYQQASPGGTLDLIHALVQTADLTIQIREPSMSEGQ